MAPMSKTDRQRQTSIPKQHRSTIEALKARGIGEVVPLDMPPAKVNKARKGLTAKQEAFAKLVAAGQTLASAYRQAYDCSNMADATIWNNASRLMSHNGVSARIDQLVRQLDEQSLHDAARLRRFMLETLHEIASDKHASDGARVRACELIGKLDVVQAFKELAPTKTPENATASELEAQLRERLTRILSATPSKQSDSH